MLGALAKSPDIFPVSRETLLHHNALRRTREFALKDGLFQALRDGRPAV
jgi:hypothetical protein